MLVVLAGTLGLLANPEVGGLRAAPRLPRGGAAAFICVQPAAGLGDAQHVGAAALAAQGARGAGRPGRDDLGAAAVPDIDGPDRPNRSAAVRSAGAGYRVPWNAAAHGALGRSRSPAAMLSLCGWTLAAFWFGRTQFERSLRYDAAAAQATPLRTAARRGPRCWSAFTGCPGAVLRDPLAGIVEKELRSLARTPRFRMVFVMGFTFGLAGVVSGDRRSRAGARGPKSQYFLIIVCVYALTLMGQVSYWNCFGFDRSAARSTSPLRNRSRRCWWARTCAALSSSTWRS